jgi:20S proteasome alpha/beta subunit
MLIPDMTLLLAMQGRDGLLIAADSRAITTRGTYSDGARKIVPVFRNCCVAYCGDDGCLARPLIDSAIDECRASPKKLGDASLFSNVLSDVTRSRFVAGSAVGERKYDFAHVVIGYLLSGEKPGHPVLSILHQDTGWHPAGEIKGWFLAAGRWDLVPYCNALLGKKSAEMTVDDLSKIAIFVLHETAKICCTVAPPLDLFIVRPDGFKRVPTGRLVRQAEIVQRELGTILRHGLGLSQLKAPVLQRATGKNKIN